MTSKLKALGLAMGAVFAFGAVAASTAAAAPNGQLTAPENVTLTGTQTSPEVTGTNAFTQGDGGKTECVGTTYTGHRVGTQGFLQSGDTAFTITPHFGTNCTSTDSGGTTRPTTIHMNGCDFVLHVGTKVGEHTYKTSTDIVCPPNQHIQKTVHAQGASSHSVFNRVCTIAIGPQTGLEGAHLTHTTENEGDDIDLKGTFKNITASQSGFCGSSHFSNVELHVDVTFEGHNELGEDIPVTITDQA